MSWLGLKKNDDDNNNNEEGAQDRQQADQHANPSNMARASEDSNSRRREPNERDRLLPDSGRRPPHADGYLDPDDPAVSPARPSNQHTSLMSSHPLTLTPNRSLPTTSGPFAPSATSPSSSSPSPSSGGSCSSSASLSRLPACRPAAQASSTSPTPPSPSASCYAPSSSSATRAWRCVSARASSP